MEHYTATLSQVSVVPTLLSALAIIVVSTLWYSPLLFGKSFIRHSSIRPGDIRPADQRRNTIIGIATALIEAYLLGIVSVHTVSNWQALAGSVVFVWLFIMLQQLKGFVFRRESLALYLLTTFRTLFSLLAGAAVFYFWSLL